MKHKAHAPEIKFDAEPFKLVGEVATEEPITPEPRNADGRTKQGQLALERCARMVYDDDRDYDYETGDD